MKKYFPLLLIFAIFSCTNFNAYYNTFYNAKKLYKEASEMPRRDDGRANSNAIGKYNQVIKKCGIILTDYKDSKYADDALMLMGKAFYYKGRGYVQAIEKFEELIKFYPESEFYEEAHLYLAKSHYQMNKKTQAIEELKELLQKKEFKEIHPQILLTLAQYYKDDENYLQAEYYLNNIVNKFPKSDEFEQAFFNLGKLYWEEEKYQRSRDTFTELINSKVSKRTKLDARYYLALNQLELKNYDQALQESRELLKDEVDPANFPKIELLIARSLANLKKTEKAAELFQKIIDENKRSKVAAQAYFYWGEMHFQITHDYEAAIEKYNQVQNQDRNSEFVEKAVSKSSVASQIIQYYHPDRTLDIETLVDQQFKLAEFYLQNLQQPDSALVVYNDIIQRKELIGAELDSLQAQLDSLHLAHPFLTETISSDSTLTTVVADSSVILPEDSTEVYIDTLSFTLTQDSLNSLPADSVKIDSTTAASDSVARKNAVIDSLQTKFTELQNQISQKQKEYKIYQDICIPHANFLKVWIYDKVKHDSTTADSLTRYLEQNYPENKYTRACRQLLNNQKIEFGTEEEQQLNEYHQAMQHLEENYSKTIELLENIASDSTHRFYQKALYALGHIQYFIREDTLAAKPYWKQILAMEDNEWKDEVQKFFDGKKFIKEDRLQAIKEAMAAEQAASDSAKVMLDSTKTVVDSMNATAKNLSALQDSTKLYSDSVKIQKPDSINTLNPAIADTLGNSENNLPLPTTKPNQNE